MESEEQIVARLRKALNELDEGDKIVCVHAPDLLHLIEAFEAERAANEDEASGG